MITLSEVLIIHNIKEPLKYLIKLWRFWYQLRITKEKFRSVDSINDFLIKMNKQLTPLINKYYLIVKKNLMVPGIEPSTTALLAQRSTDWAIRPSYLLMHNLLQILLSREKRKYWRSKRHMLFASWHFPSLILAPCFALLSSSFHSFFFLFLFVC